MARLALTLSGVGKSASSDADPVMGSSFAADKTAFETALAQLVTDAAAPTQAHVTTANSAYTTFKADLGSVPTTKSLVVSVDTSVFDTVSKLRAAFNELLFAAEATGMTK